ncbi:uncharacterized protein METZ01_LOCUS407273, partial [marine metagenome]
VSDVGYQTNHSDITLNFMLNRKSANIEPDELSQFSADITGLESWVEASLQAVDI